MAILICISGISLNDIPGYYEDEVQELIDDAYYDTSPGAFDLIGEDEIEEAVTLNSSDNKLSLSESTEKDNTECRPTNLYYLHSKNKKEDSSNQGIKFESSQRIVVWNNLRFRSKTEVKIAEALDRTDALFYPNCKARLDTPTGKDNRESDFLVFYKGKCGILEVDGDEWHPPSRIVNDHKRDRLFKAHGITIVEHYDAKECFEHPDSVVQEFLKILSQA